MAWPGTIAMPAVYPYSVPAYPPNFVVQVLAPVPSPMAVVSSTAMGKAPSPQARQNCFDGLCTPAKGEAHAPSEQVLMQRLKEDMAALEHNRAALIAKNGLKLSRDQDGCRLVQQALEDAVSDEARLALVETLRGHVWEVAVCPHANHVLQKFIVTMKPAACQFIVDELAKHGAGSASKLAQHKYGYRIFQRLLEHLMPHQTAQLVEELMTECVSMSMHRFGTYVMQHVLEYGTDINRERVIAALVAQIAKLSLNNDACMVLDVALAKCDMEIQDVLVQALVASGGAIGAMAHTRRGHVVVLSMLELVAGEQLEEAMRQLAQQVPSLQKSRFGRIVLKSVQLHCGGIFDGAVGGA